jgi:hypothetical protein
VVSVDESPTDISIEFISENRKDKGIYGFTCNLSVQLGKFAKPDSQRSILFE